MEKKKVIKPRIFKGTRDFLPEEMVQREKIINILKTIFTKYGIRGTKIISFQFIMQNQQIKLIGIKMKGL